MATHTTNAAGTGYEPDVEGRGLLTLLVYIVVLAAMFFGTLGALFVYFRWETDQEIHRKVNTYESPELKDLRSREDQQLQQLDQAIKATAQSLGATTPKAPTSPGPAASPPTNVAPPQPLPQGGTPPPAPQGAPSPTGAGPGQITK